MTKGAKIAFLIVLLLHMGALFIWQSMNDMPHGLDEMDVSQDAVRWAVQWDRVESNKQAFSHIIDPGTKTPPGSFWVYAVVSNFLEPGWRSLKFVPAFGFLLILFGVFILARESAGDWAGVLGMFLVGCYPLVFGFAHTTNTSTLAAGFEIMALALLVKSQDMIKPHIALLAAACIGFAIMSERGTPIIIMGPPVAFLFIKAVVRAATDREIFLRRIPGLIAFALSPLIIAGKYLHTYITGNLEYTLGNIANDALKVSTYWPWPDYIEYFYIVEYGRRQAGGLLALAMFLALIPLIRNKAKEGWAMIVACFGPMLIFSLIATKEVAYDFGVLPVGAAITAAGIMSIEKTAIKKAALGIVIPVAALTGLIGATGIGHSLDNDADTKLFRAAFGTRSEILYGPPVTGVPLLYAAEIMRAMIPRDRFMVVAMANDEQRPMAWALMIQVAANRFDATAVLAPSLPGSDKGIVALAPVAPLDEAVIQEMKEICSWSDLGVCDPTSGEDERGARLQALLEGISVEVLEIQTWKGHPVTLGVYQ